MVLFVCFITNSQTLIGKSKDTTMIGQVILQKVLEIKETDNSFYFRYPYKIYADLQENVYVLDSNRLLKFSKAGIYLKNLVKIGQGPGEIINISNVYITEGHIIIHNNNPAKIIWIDRDGKLKKEIRFEKNDWLSFSHYHDNAYFFFKSTPPEKKSSDTYINLPYQFLQVSLDGKKQDTVYNFTKKSYLVRNGGAWGLFDIADLKSYVYEGNYIFLYHTPEYNIKCIDINKNKAIKEFGVKYKRQEIPGEKSEAFNKGMMILNGKRYKKPVQKYFNDIRNLLGYKKNLWVVTSNVNKEKGVRVDIFNFGGENIDRFYLKLQGQADLYSVNWFISGNYLYSLETPEDGDPKVIKCKIDI
jgi:hypothetical protein